MGIMKDYACLNLNKNKSIFHYLFHRITHLDPEHVLTFYSETTFEYAQRALIRCLQRPSSGNETSGPIRGVAAREGGHIIWGEYCIAYYCYYSLIATLTCFTVIMYV